MITIYMEKAKRRLFFLLFSMNVGGVEKSFLSLLDTLSQHEYEVHVGLLQRRGEFIGMLPSWVEIHDCCMGCWEMLNDPPLCVIKKNLKNGHFILSFQLLGAYMIYKLTNDITAYYNVVLRQEHILDEFDAAYAYAGPASIIDYYICRKIHAKKKYGWIHFDVEKFGIDRALTRKLYKEYDTIFVVSEAAKSKFDKIFPEFQYKTDVRYNLVSCEQILSLSKDGQTFQDSYKGKRILTVGRLSKEKGQDVTIKALKILVEKGIDVKWYYVGDGDLRMECEQLAQAAGVSDRVSFLGVTPNPYGYMRDCNIYVQPSRHEGFCITLAEAKCFSVPIVSTNFTGAKEQLETYPQSVVTEMDAEAIAHGIIKILR